MWTTDDENGEFVESFSGFTNVQSDEADAEVYL